MGTRDRPRARIGAALGTLLAVSAGTALLAPVSAQRTAPARARLEAQVARAPDDARARCRLAFVLTDDGDLGAAREHLIAAIPVVEAAPPGPQRNELLAACLHNLGRVEARARQWAQAADAYRRAQEVRPHRATVEALQVATAHQLAASPSCGIGGPLGEAPGARDGSVLAHALEGLRRALAADPSAPELRRCAARLQEALLDGGSGGCRREASPVPDGAIDQQIAEIGATRAGETLWLTSGVRCDLSRALDAAALPLERASIAPLRVEGQPLLLVELRFVERGYDEDERVDFADVYEVQLVLDRAGRRAYESSRALSLVGGRVRTEADEARWTDGHLARGRDGSSQFDDGAALMLAGTVIVRAPRSARE